MPTTEPTDAHDRLLDVEDVSVHFTVRGAGLLARRETLHAVDGVSFHVAPGETLGVVGESGSGKTTLGYAVLGHYQPTTGRVVFKGTDITGYRGARLRDLRRQMQMIFQDPYSSLNPRMRIEEIVGEPLIVHGLVSNKAELRARVGSLLELTGLSTDIIDRYPHAFSGGQRQRIGIARALALEPELLVADEPTSALDVSVQAQVINLMQELQQRLHLAYVFISHNLAVVRHISHRIAIMYAGRLVEIAPAAAIFDEPRHPYTKALLSAIPVPDSGADWHQRRLQLDGETPSPISPPRGCRFNTRCPVAVDQCFIDDPPLEQKADGHWAACWLAPAATATADVAVGAPAGVGDRSIPVAVRTHDDVSRTG